jgi:hypothetical protein
MSHNARQMPLLLEPLIRAAGATGKSADRGVRVELLGGLHPREKQALPSWRRRFESCDWEFVERAPVPRDEFLRELLSYDGLLLLSASRGAVPSKLYEYLQTGLPVLAVCPRDSAVAEIAERQPAMEFVEMGKADDSADSIARFLAACREGRRFDAPPEYSDDALAAQFLGWLQPLFSGG